MTPSQRKVLKWFLACLMHLAGPALWIGYKLTTELGWLQWHFDFHSHRTEFAIIAATYAFTMLAFMSASIAIIFSASKVHIVKLWARQYRSEVRMVYASSIATLLLIFPVAMLTVAENTPACLLDLTGILIFNSLIQIMLFNVIIYGLMNRRIDHELKSQQQV